MLGSRFYQTPLPSTHAPRDSRTPTHKHTDTRCKVHMRAESQVGYSGPQLTSKVHLPTPGEPNKFDVNRRPSVKPRATRLSASSPWFPRKPPAKIPGARAQHLRKPRLAPGGAGARRPLRPHARPAPSPPLTPPSLRGAVGLQAPVPAPGAGAVPRSLGGSSSRAFTALECSGVCQPSSSASECFGVRCVRLCERP